MHSGGSVIDAFGAPCGAACRGRLDACHAADAESKALFAASGIARSASNLWAIAYVRGKEFAYALSRKRRFSRLACDLATAVDAPPPPSGDD